MLARMRTISEAARYIKGIDPESALTETAIRRMLKIGELPCVRAGNKYLVNLDKLIEHLNHPELLVELAPVHSGIRKIPEKI